jgi:hypothetical protein
MHADSELAKRLNLLRTSPSFVLRDQQDGSQQVLSLEIVPNDDFTYWVAAQSTLADGTVLETVVVISGGGASTEAFYWFHDGSWYRQDENDFLTKAHKTNTDVYPFDWRYKIPVTNDPYHPEKEAQQDAP